MSPADAAVGQGFNLNLSDVRFILKQIKIAEAHAASATPANPCGTLLGTGPNQIPNGNQQGAELPWGLRTVDGTCNNLLPGKSKLGAADTVFPRSAPARFRDAENGTSYTQKKGTVRDSHPRVVSNLVVDQTPTNPAAVAAAGGALPDASGTLPIPNVATDTGLSAPFNSLFTIFGQFFDHGLDLTTKGGGTVMMPLKEDDPLFVPGSPTNFMVLTRATNQPGPDGITGDRPATAVDESADDVQEATNTTTSFVDQNQTYTSHPSHQVFLREFTRAAGGPTVDTGRLLGGAGGEGLATWAIVKAEALSKLGIVLTDTDIFNVPLLDTDQYGNFRPGPNGYPQLVTASGLVEGSAAGTAIPADAVRTGHAFLDDIAHHAVPSGDRNPNDGPGPIEDLDPDGDAGTADDGDPTTYDDEMLNAHFVGGDGRVNENIALSSVHHIFHSEHNRLMADIDRLISTETARQPGRLAQLGRARAWDYGQRLFQAARFVTEMEYQHLVFEEFARKVQPMVNLFGEGGTGYHTEIDPSIRAEFAHAVYRFGHSMLTETVARTNANNSNNDIDLISAFLNPPEFFDGGAAGPLTADQAAGSVVRGMTRQVGNQIDEFVTEALRNNLLGLPLDLATINMARARDAGVPPLNWARREFEKESGNSALAPYDELGRPQLRPEEPRHAGEPHRRLRHSHVHPGRHDRGRQARCRAGAGRPGCRAPPEDPADSEDAFNFLNSLPERLGEQRRRRHQHRRRRHRPVGRRSRREAVRVRRHARLHVQLRVRDPDGGPAGRRPVLLPVPHCRPQPADPARGQLVRRADDAQHRRGHACRPTRSRGLTSSSTWPSSGPPARSWTTPDTEWNEATMLIRNTNGTIRFAGTEHVAFNGTENGDRLTSSEGDDTMRGNDGDDCMQGGDGNDNHIGGLGDDILQRPRGRRRPEGRRRR